MRLSILIVNNKQQIGELENNLLTCIVPKTTTTTKIIVN